jgi:hypothetical protein
MIVFMLILAVFLIYHGRKTKNNVHYMSSGFCGSWAFAFLVGALGQFLLCIILMGVFTLVGFIVLWPRLMRNMPEETAKAKETVDTSGPIRLSDVFSVRFMIKLESKYGERSAMIIWSAVGAAVAAPVLVAMVLLGVTTWPFGAGALVFGVIASLFFYRRMRRGLNA